MDDYLTMSALQSFNNSLANSANIIMASETSRQDRKFSREMSNLAWERNLEAWRMQNDYNLPANQYARQLEGLQANGLNPNLVYGNSGAVTGSSGSVSPYKFEGYHATAVPQFKGLDPIQTVLSTRLMQTQIAAQEAQNRLINARADNEIARNPGLMARSSESAARWQYILNHMDDQESAWRATQSLEYWKGQQAFSNAEILKNKASLSYYEVAMAEWLNTAIVPGTELTYRQYMEKYKSLIPSAQWSNFKQSTLNFASQIAYRKSQGELLGLKKIYQQYANKFARFGRSIGSDWVTTLISGLYELYDGFIRGGHVTEREKDPISRGASEPGDW